MTGNEKAFARILPQSCFFEDRVQRSLRGVPPLGGLGMTGKRKRATRKRRGTPPPSGEDALRPSPGIEHAGIFDPDLSQYAAS